MEDRGQVEAGTSLGRSSLAEMESDLAAVDALKSSVLVKLQELAYGGNEKAPVRRVRVSELFNRPIRSQEDLESAVQQIRDALEPNTRLSGRGPRRPRIRSRRPIAAVGCSTTYGTLYHCPRSWSMSWRLRADDHCGTGRGDGDQGRTFRGHSVVFTEESLSRDFSLKTTRLGPVCGGSVPRRGRNTSAQGNAVGSPRSPSEEP